MNNYQPGFARFEPCFPFLNTPQGSIIFTAIIALLLVQCLDNDSLERAGGILQSIGELMSTATLFDC